MKILIAEDTKDLNRVLTAALSREGYLVDSALDGVEASEFLAETAYDVVILDIMMPRKNGLEVLREMRRMKNATPVLLLTAKAEVEDRVEGLDAGADDYLPKPFAIKELLARVRALGRRRMQEAGDEEISFGDVHLSGVSFEMKCENSVILSIREYSLMHALATAGGTPLTSEILLSRIFSGVEHADEQTLVLYIAYLRSKLQAISSRVKIAGTKEKGFYLEGI